MKTCLLFLAILFVNCSEQIKDAASGIKDPTERGLMYVACGLVFAALIRAIL